MKVVIRLGLLSLAGVAASAQAPDNLVLDGIPPIPPALKAQATPYLESRAAAFRSWHPRRPEMLITTRFADTAQLHEVRMPGGARRQLTFSSEPVGDGQYQPGAGEFLVFSQDTGGRSAAMSWTHRRFQTPARSRRVHRRAQAHKRRLRCASSPHSKPWRTFAYSTINTGAESDALPTPEVGG